MLKVFPRLQNTAQISKWPLGESVRMAGHFPFNPIEQQQFQGFGSQVNKQNCEVVLQRLFIHRPKKPLCV